MLGADVHKFVGTIPPVQLRLSFIKGFERSLRLDPFGPASVVRHGIDEVPQPSRQVAIHRRDTGTHGQVSLKDCEGSEYGVPCSIGHRVRVDFDLEAQIRRVDEPPLTQIERTDKTAIAVEPRGEFVFAATQEHVATDIEVTLASSDT